MREMRSCATKTLALGWVKEFKKRNPKAKYVIKKEELPKYWKGSDKWCYTIYEH